MNTAWILGLFVVGLAIVAGAYLMGRSREAVAQEIVLGGVSFAITESEDAPNAAAANQKRAELQSERTRLAALPPDELIAQLLEDPHPDHLVGQAIQARAAELASRLLEAIFDPRFRGGSHQHLRQPWEPRLTALMLYAPHASAQSVPRLAPLVTDPSQQIRNWAGRALGVSGAREAAAPLSRLLADDDSARVWALTGVRSSINSGHATPEFRAGLFDAVAALVFRGAHSGEAAACILELDRARAIPLLTSDERLQLGQENLASVLEACLAADVQPPEASTLRLAAEISARTEADGEHGLLATLLQLLANEKSPAAVAAIERGRKHPAKEVREAAAKARVRAAGLPDPFKAAFDRWSEQGWQGLTEPQRHVLAVRVLANQISNAGIHGYFYSSYGDTWRDAAAGLAAIGATNDCACFEKVIALFGDTPPGPNEESRSEQVEAMTEHAGDELEVLEQSFYTDPDEREVLLREYILKHADDFRPPASDTRR